MAEQSGIDVLMRIVLTTNGLAMGAESYTGLEPIAAGDPMLRDFTPGQFCELRQFDFAAGVQSMIKKEETPSTPAPPKPTDDITKQVLKTHWDRFQKRDQGDFVDMQPVSYSRILDIASPTLFKALKDCTTLASITIVKRKAAGSATSGLGYLRIDFKDVLMTALTWQDSQHIMIETGTFIYRNLTIEYKVQKPDGSLVSGSTGEWAMKVKRTSKTTG